MQGVIKEQVGDLESALAAQRAEDARLAKLAASVDPSKVPVDEAKLPPRKRSNSATGAKNSLHPGSPLLESLAELYPMSPEAAAQAEFQKMPSLKRWENYSGSRDF